MRNEKFVIAGEAITADIIKSKIIKANELVILCQIILKFQAQLE